MPYDTTRPSQKYADLCDKGKAGSMVTFHLPIRALFCTLLDWINSKSSFVFRPLSPTMGCLQIFGVKNTIPAYRPASTTRGALRSDTIGLFLLCPTNGDIRQHCPCVNSFLTSRAWAIRQSTRSSSPSSGYFPWIWPGFYRQRA